jgi:hypothetical protein
MKLFSREITKMSACDTVGVALTNEKHMSC